ncbi:hypothetical protein niasHT_038092 [Heterodera trifolii]|uniref:Dolichyl-phosphate beta-glucosyltransferase n=1 Tax=Heterodera trifolii TaxID=157864 RepID=A0ABD2HS81_9BILA
MVSAIAQYFLAFLLSASVLAFFSFLLLTALSIFKPWTKRNKSHFVAPRFHFRPEEEEEANVQFPCLLTREETSWKGLQHSEPELYLSVIVPAKNEEKRLPRMLDECLKYLEKRAAKDSEFTYENKEFPFRLLSWTMGAPTAPLMWPSSTQGGAVREGALCARGQFILFADADGASRFSDFRRLEKQMHLLCNGDVLPSSEPTDWTHPAIVVGSRAHLEEESMSRRSILRTVLMVGFHVLVWVFAVRSVRDTQCGFKLLSRAAAAKLFPQLHIEQWAFDVELIYLAEHLQYSIAEVAVEWTEIEGSKVTPVFSWIQMGVDIPLIWFRYTFNIWNLNEVDLS